MFNFNKKVCAGLIAALVIHAPISFSFAEFTNIYQEQELKQISPGVTYENILRFTDKGWLNLNIMRVNLNDRYTSLDVLTSAEGLSSRGQLTKLATNDENSDNIVGAINGDFFDTKTFATMGPIVKDGELITTSIFDPKFATFNINDFDQAFLDYWRLTKVTLENENNGYLLNIGFVNKPYIVNNTVLLDKNWGQMSFGNESYPDIVEIVVEDNKVTDIRQGLEAVEIPEDGFVISTTGTYAQTLLDNFSVKDDISLSIENDPNIENIKLTLGGGAIILKDGQVLEDFSVKIPGSHPRTALGITEDKEEVILLTVDGRTSSYPGVTQSELAELLKELGAYNAINLDGGGSTEMIIREPGKEDLSIANYPSDQFERSLVNALAVLNDAPESSFKDIEIDLEEETMFAGTSIDIEINGYDKNYRPYEVDPEDVKWDVVGVEGEFNGSTFSAITSGKAVITASYRGKSASCEIRVLDKPQSLEIYPSQILMDTDSEVKLEIYGIDSEGYGAKITAEDIDWNIPNSLGRVEDNKFISSNKSASDIIEASIGELKYHIPIAIGYDEVILDDFETDNGQFLSYPEEVTGQYSLSSKEKNGSKSGKLSYDFSTTTATRAAYIVFNNDGIDIEKKPQKLGMWVYGRNGNEHWLRGNLVDANGTTYKLDFARSVNWKGWEFVEVNVPSEAVAPLKLQRVYLAETDPNYLDSGYIYIDDITAFYNMELPSNIPQNVEGQSDIRNTPSELQGEDSFRFIAHGKVDNIDTLLDNLVLDKMADLSEEAGFSVFASSIDEELKNKITNNHIVGDRSYSMINYKNSTFIKLDNTGGSMRTANLDQWPWLLDVLDNIEGSNLFILMPEELTFNDELEEKLFFDTLQSLKDEKNIDVWVLTGGNNDEYHVDVKDGVRIVNLKSYPEHNGIDIFDELKYMEFTVNDGYVTYEIKNMYTE